MKMICIKSYNNDNSSILTINKIYNAYKIDNNYYNFTADDCTSWYTTSKFLIPFKIIHDKKFNNILDKELE